MRSKKIPNSAPKRIQEIGKILAHGIFRLGIKEKAKNSQILLDNKLTSSLHSVDSKTNQHFLTL